MFGLFKRKTLLDQTIKAIYGGKPSKKTADTELAVALVVSKLLPDVLDAEGVARITSLAKELNADQMPYSTYDLAVCVALNVFKNTEASARQGLFHVQLVARMTALEWAKEGKLAKPLLGIFEDTLYKLYKPQPAAERELISAEELGKGIAELLNLEEMLAIVREWHPASGSKVFIALASLRLTGFKIAVRQQSIASRLGKGAVPALEARLIRELVSKEMKSNDDIPEMLDGFTNVMNVSVHFSETFAANAGSEPPNPLPHWFVGKSVCAFLEDVGDAPNPEQVMLFSQFLADSITAPKKLLDELLDAGVSIVATSPDQQSA